MCATPPRRQVPPQAQRSLSPSHSTRRSLNAGVVLYLKHMNYTRFFIVCALVISLSLPPTLSAQTTSDVQSQINQLLEQIRQLQQQILQLRTQVTAPSTPPGRPDNWRHRICLVARNLQLRDENDDVRSLQEFLREEGLLSAEATGFFGDLTLQALRKWQANNLGITSGDALTTGWGVFGPRSRVFLARWCGGSNPGSTNLIATPAAGRAPLGVAFSARNVWEGSSEFRITFGDGSEGTMQHLSCAGECAQNPLSASHTYASAGTYTATLYRKVLNDCQSTASTTCAAWVDREDAVGSARVFVVATSSLGNLPPVVTGFSGPTTLNLNQNGTWTITATDPENSQLSYQIRWGDENRFDDLLAIANINQESFVQQSTFTHAYSRAGTYRVSVAVRDSAGQVARTTTTVRVGTPPSDNIIACTQELMQCPNGEWVGRSGQYCQFACGGVGNDWIDPLHPISPPGQLCTYGDRQYEEGGTYTLRNACPAGVGFNDLLATCSTTYVCRGGSWVTAPVNWVPGQPPQQNASCAYGGVTYEHGAVAPCGFILGNQCYTPETLGVSGSGAHTRSVCVNGSWQIRN